jgi:hypothetical protein
MSGVGPLMYAPPLVTANSTTRLAEFVPVAHVGPDSVTKARSCMDAGKPLPPKVEGWIQAMLTGPTV